MLNLENFLKRLQKSNVLFSLNSAGETVEFITKSGQKVQVFFNKLVKGNPVKMSHVENPNGTMYTTSFLLNSDFLRVVQNKYDNKGREVLRTVTKISQPASQSKSVVSRISIFPNKGL